MRATLLALAAALAGMPALAQQPASGSWSGVGLEVSGGQTQTYTVRVQLDAGGGKIDYPTLPCGGTLTPLQAQGGVQEFREKLTYGLDKCVDGGTVGIVVKGDTLIWYWTGEGTNQPDSVVSAVLRRE